MRRRFALLASLVLSLLISPLPVLAQVVLPENTARITRYEFSDGRAFFDRTVRIIERPDGTGFMEVSGRDTPYGAQNTVLERRRIPLSSAKLEQLAQMAQASTSFDFEEGTWDDPERIYIHCQTLEMVQISAEGRRSSQISIGCNRPDRLMPLIYEVIALAGIGSVTSGWAGH